MLASESLVSWKAYLHGVTQSTPQFLLHFSEDLPNSKLGENLSKEGGLANLVALLNLITSNKTCMNEMRCWEILRK